MEDNLERNIIGTFRVTAGYIGVWDTRQGGL
jgi:hypothetical protein